MARYNSGVKYNVGAENDGFNYNGKEYVRDVRTSDSFGVSDASLVTVIIFMRETPVFREVIRGLSDKVVKETFALLRESAKANARILPKEPLILDDRLVKLLRTAQVKERAELTETVKQSAKATVKEKVNVSDIAKIFADYIMNENLSLETLINLLASTTIYDATNIIDKDPRTAVSDIYVAKDTSGIYDILLPFGLIMDWERTDFPFMPEATDETERLSGIDGEIIQSTVYEARPFSIAAVTFTGLTVAEKEEIKRHIAQVLHSIKNRMVKMTLGERGTTFDVKYTGMASAKDYAGWVQFELPLKAPYPLGKKEFGRKVKGSGLLENVGDEPCGFVVKLKGAWSSPSFTVGDTRFSFSTSLAEGETLVIDTEKQICTINRDGRITNAVPFMTSGALDKKIPVGSVVLSVREDKASNIETTYTELVIY